MSGTRHNKRDRRLCCYPAYTGKQHLAPGNGYTEGGYWRVRKCNEAKSHSTVYQKEDKMSLQRIRRALVNSTYTGMAYGTGFTDENRILAQCVLTHLVEIRRRCTARRAVKID